MTTRFLDPRVLSRIVRLVLLARTVVVISLARLNDPRSTEKLLRVMQKDDKPIVRVRYEFAEMGTPGLGSLVEDFLEVR